MTPAVAPGRVCPEKTGRVRIGIFGGSFNPVHCGHVKLAVCARKAFDLDRVIFVPCRRPVLKPVKDLLPASLRVRLLRSAVSKTPGFSVSSCELRRRSPSYTVNTLRHFRKKFGSNVELFFIAGQDTLKDFSLWKSPGEVLKLCRFLVAVRKGFGKSGVEVPVLGLPWKPVKVSSTLIRERLKARRDIRGLVPEETRALLTEYFKAQSVNQGGLSSTSKKR